jgi:glycosyltransferase involved in cell wall biosynthesis
LGLAVGTLAGTPAIAWNIRRSEMILERWSGLSTLVVRLLGRLSSVPHVVVVNSEMGRRVHERMNYRPRRWEVIPNGFDLSIFRPDPEARVHFRNEMGIAADTLLIGLIARYDPIKDHRTFLCAAQCLLHDWPDVHFILIGRGVDHDNRDLTAIMQDFGISDRVHLVGREMICPASCPHLTLL